MKLSSITAALGINKTAKAAKTIANNATVVTKPAPKKASGAEVLAAQNKAMIKMENPRSLKATSGFDGNNEAAGGRPRTRASLDTFFDYGFDMGSFLG